MLPSVRSITVVAVSQVPHQLHDITALFFDVQCTVSLSIWPEVLCRFTVSVIIFMGLSFIFREQRQKEANKMAVNSFPKDRDYRREVMQATATSGFASGSKY